jgi:hypothetical protein
MGAYENLSTEARELVLWAENTSSLYPQKTYIVANVERKLAKGIYNPTLAPKLWRYWTDAASKDYKREFGYGFSPSARQEAAEYLAITELDELMLQLYPQA